MNGLLQLHANEIAQPLCTLLRDHRKAEGKLKAYYRKAIDQMVRHLEYLVVPGVSVAAQNLADELGLGDLRQCDWSNGSARRALSWEHHPPVSDLRVLLSNLTDPTEDAVREIIEGAGVYWITKDENAGLPKHKRGDPVAAYAHINMRHECRRT